MPDPRRLSKRSPPVLACFWVPEKGWLQGLYHSLFYTISAFNDAGFALSPDSPSPHVTHSGIILAVSALFITGGLGYAVVMEVAEKRRFRTLSLSCRITLGMRASQETTH